MIFRNQLELRMAKFPRGLGSYVYFYGNPDLEKRILAKQLGDCVAANSTQLCLADLGSLGP